jgi:hypothetical protein
MKKYFIFSDVHGEFDILLSFLIKAGFEDGKLFFDGEEIPDGRVREESEEL